MQKIEDKIERQREREKQIYPFVSQIKTINNNSLEIFRTRKIYTVSFKFSKKTSFNPSYFNNPSYNYSLQFERSILRFI